MPSALISLCSAFSRMEQVLKITRSASVASSVACQPDARRTSSIRRESWTFIWQPMVWTMYRLVMANGET